MKHPKRSQYKYAKSPEEQGLAEPRAPTKLFTRRVKDQP